MTFQSEYFSWHQNLCYSMRSKPTTWCKYLQVKYQQIAHSKKMLTSSNIKENISCKKLVHSTGSTMANWVFKINSVGQKNASQILFEDGFEILRLDILGTTMSFHEMPTVRPLLDQMSKLQSHPQFNFVFVKFFGFYVSKITKKDCLLENSNIMIGF